MDPAHRERAWAFLAGVIVCSILSTSLGFITRENNGILSGTARPTFGKSKALTNETTSDYGRGFDISKYWRRRRDEGTSGNDDATEQSNKHIQLQNGTRAFNASTVGELQGLVRQNGTNTIRVAHKTSASVTAALACVMVVVVSTLTAIGAIMLVRRGDNAQRQEEEEETEEIVESLVRNVLDEVAPEEAV